MSKAATAIDMELSGLQTRRELVWQTVRACGIKGTFTEQDVDGVCMPPLPTQDVSRYLREFAAGGALEVVGKTAHKQTAASSRFKSPIYRLLKTSGEAPGTPLLGTLAMWRAMKIMKSFDSKDLARAASHPAAPVSPTTARMYVRFLYQAGYLLQTKPGKTAAGGASRYMLVRNTGPHAPSITRVKCVLDRNTGELIQLQTAAEVTHDIK